MADINCGCCGEPWELYYVNHELEANAKHDPDAPSNPVDTLLGGDGCPTCDWGDNPDASIGQSESEDEIEERHFRSLVDAGRDPTEYQ